MKFIKFIHNDLNHAAFAYLKPQASGDWVAFIAVPALHLTKKMERTIPVQFLSRIKNAGQVGASGIRMVRLNPTQTANVIALLDVQASLAKIRRVFPEFDEKVPTPTLQTVAAFLVEQKINRYIQIQIN